MTLDPRGIVDRDGVLHVYVVHEGEPLVECVSINDLMHVTAVPEQASSESREQSGSRLAQGDLIADTQKQLDVLKAAVTDCQLEIENLTAVATEHRNEITRLGSAASRARIQVDNLQATVAERKATASEYQLDINRLAALATERRDEITLLGSAASQARTEVGHLQAAVDNSRADMASIVTDHRREMASIVSKHREEVDELESRAALRRKEVDELKWTVTKRRKEIADIESDAAKRMTVATRQPIDIGDHMIVFELAGDPFVQKVLRENLSQHYVSAKGHRVLSGTSRGNRHKNHSENKVPPPPHITGIIQALFRMVEGGLFRAFNLEMKGVQGSASIIIWWRYKGHHQDMHLDFGPNDEGVPQAASWFSVVVPLNEKRTLRYLICGKAEEPGHVCTVACTRIVEVPVGCAAAFKSKTCWHGGVDVDDAEGAPKAAPKTALFMFCGPTPCVCMHEDGTATYGAELGLEQYVRRNDQMRTEL